MSSDSLSTSADAQENNQLAPCTLARTTFAPLSTVPSVNSLVQAFDEDGVWSNGTVKTIHSDGTITVKFDGWRNQFNNRVNSTYARQRIESPEVTKRRRSAKYKVDVTKIIAEDTVWFSEEGGGEEPRSLTGSGSSQARSRLGILQPTVLYVWKLRYATHMYILR
ncbi:hypothetical protein Bbelb_019320 [Branchiostoma belcheri]|nr:hypothetical protein Bbelb_019320 [Branchiostoma belcheri]